MNLSGEDIRGRVKFGIIGGSGMCKFDEIKTVFKIKPETKYGDISDEILICEVNGQLVAFIPRHGSEHSIAPHKVPYKANLLALKEIGVEYVIGTCIVGSLKKEIEPGSIVLPNQFVNFTWGRDDYVDMDNGSFVHLPMDKPYCENLGNLIASAANNLNMPVKKDGTVVVIQGPRFSTIAESKWLSSNNWDIVNMTQYPECYLAKELGLCYAAIASVTDYDVGLQKQLTIGPEQMNAILDIFQNNIKNVKALLLKSLDLFGDFSCNCAKELTKNYYEENL